MAVKPQYKANQLAKDLNIKSKEIVDVMAKKGIELKAQKALEPHEFNVLFDAITAEYQSGGTYTRNAKVTLYAVWEKVLIDVNNLTISEIEDQTYKNECMHVCT